MKAEEKAKEIKVVILDVDGVLTDGRIIIGEEGKEYKCFDSQDGLGIRLGQEGGLRVGFVTARESGNVAKRAAELGVEEVHQNVSDKSAVVAKIMAKYGLRRQEMAYIGDDLTDLKAMRLVGFRVAVAGAAGEVKEIADYITKRSGGSGAVREVIEYILKAQGKWVEVLDRYF